MPNQADPVLKIIGHTVTQSVGFYLISDVRDIKDTSNILGNSKYWVYRNITQKYAKYLNTLEYK